MHRDGICNELRLVPTFMELASGTQPPVDMLIADYLELAMLRTSDGDGLASFFRHGVEILISLPMSPPRLLDEVVERGYPGQSTLPPSTMPAPTLIKVIEGILDDPAMIRTVVDDVAGHTDPIFIDIRISPAMLLDGLHDHLFEIHSSTRPAAFRTLDTTEMHMSRSSPLPVIRTDDHHLPLDPRPPFRPILEPISARLARLRHEFLERHAPTHGRRS